MLNYGKHVPSAVSHVTLAHEIGHNFGSPVRISTFFMVSILLLFFVVPTFFFFATSLSRLYIRREFLYVQHDPDGCTPGGDDGNFIMFARATSGDKKNNNKFSPCSLHAINPVLNVKARSSKGCFTGEWSTSLVCASSSIS